MVSGGNILTIAPGRPFLATLAAGLLHETGGDVERLADYLILLPTRRACRALADAFLEAGGGRPLILPDIRPLGDVEEEGLALRLPAGDAALALPPAIPEARRILLLTKLILRWKGDRDVATDQAVRLAGELARLLDQVQTERLDFAALKDLAPDRFAEHWQEVLEFLEIVTEHWPEILEDEGCIDPADRRNRLLEAQARLWRESPPRNPVIAAGSTGSVPATADLLEVVTALPQGRVVLPGLDRALGADDRKAALREVTHPQHGMLLLLKRLGADPSGIGDWNAGPDGPAGSSPPERSRFVAEILRPTGTTEGWRALEKLPDAALNGVQRIDCANEGEEAGVAALMLRQALETEGRTAALVTPDRQLARRVAAELKRWEIEIDDSAGRPLADTPPGVYLRLVARAAAEELSPVILLSLLKHPICAGGMARDRFRSIVRAFEEAVLRGPRPGPGIAGLRALVEGSSEIGEEFDGLLQAIEHCLDPLCRLLQDGARPLGDLIDAHIAAAEAMASSDAGDGVPRLWKGEDGEALAAAVAEMRQAAEILESVDGAEYAALFETLLGGATVRPRYGLHPRLNIWGPLEARLLHADLMVLGGLNERSWPPDAGNDPWMSRPMRQAFGLPAVERRIGLAAHDFAQAMAAPRVVLLRAGKAEGSPTVPSRWLTRLEAVLEAAGRKDGLQSGPPWRSLHHALARPAGPVRIEPPAPRPPVEARPRRLSVTQVETWMRDPYAIYARHILGLKALDPLEADPGAAERGSFIHEALDRFVRDNPDRLPRNAMQQLEDIGKEAFGAALSRPAVAAFWWPRYQRIAAWFLAQERERRADIIERSDTERWGRLELPGPAGPFTVVAKADRIDRLKAGDYAIVDYKTGAPPSRDQVAFGYAPQLPLEAAILAAGGFEDLAAGIAVELAYWRLSGGEPPGEVKPVKADARELAEAAQTGLAALVRTFDDPKTPYLATPRPEWAPAWNDYEHLARVLEWSAGGGGIE